MADPLSGGTVTDVDGYRYRTFTAGGELTFLGPDPIDVECFGIGPGAGGGRVTNANGAGGGGSGEAGAIPLEALAESLTITLGTPGLGATAASTNGQPGGTTTIIGDTVNLSFVGGGYGAGANSAAGGAGGSGGGGRGAAAGTAGGSQGDGGPGGNGESAAARGGGGGGGASTDPGDNAANGGGDGGDGVEWPPGSGDFYGGGGGGGAIAGSSGDGGLGGGGNGGLAGPGQNATGYGSGGGGSGSTGNGGNGSPAIVIFRYIVPVDPPSVGDGMVLEVWRLPANEYLLTLDPGVGVNAVDRADGTLGATFRVAVSGVGSMDLELPLDVEAAALIDLDRDYVRCYVDGVLLASGVIEIIDEHRLDENEGAGQRLRITGRGQGAVFDWWCTIPANGLDASPVEEDRLFSWQAPQFDSSAWADVKEIAPATGTTRTAGNYVPMSGPPADAPQIPNSFWIWDTSGTEWYAPGGDCYARTTFNAPTAVDVEVGFALDNYGSIWIDGQPIGVLTIASGRRNFLECHKYNLRLSAGDHTIAVFATNRGTPAPGGSPPFEHPNPSGIFAYVATLDDNLEIATVLTQTDDTWDLLGYPATPPGMTAGQAIVIQHTEAQAFDALDWFTLDFDEDVDSNGDPWDQTGEITTRTSTGFLTFLDELSSTYIDWHFTPDMTTLRAFNRGSMALIGGSPVALEPAPVNDPRSGTLIELDRTRQ